MGAIGGIDGGNLGPAADHLGRPITSAGDLADLALQDGYSQLWIHPSAHAGLGLPDRLPPQQASLLARQGVAHPFTDRARPYGLIHPEGLAHWIVVRPHHRPGARCDLSFPAFDQSSGLHLATDARAMVRAVKAFNGFLGITYRWSPGTASSDLIRATHRGPTAVRLDASGELPPPAEDAGAEMDFRWSRAPDLEERGRRWVYGFDANGLYLAAASTVELGFGEPEHVFPKRPHAGLGLAKGPGYWRLAPGQPGDPELPDPLFPASGTIGGPVWRATPAAELGLELARISRIDEAWLYPRHHRYLSGWYDRLRKAREALLARDDEPGRLALQLVKRTYKIGIGSLAGHFRSPGEELFRPDWRHAIIARARSNLYRRIAKLPPGRRPFAVDVDALFFASDEEDPARVVPGLPIGQLLGQFSYEGRAPMEDALDSLNGGAGTVAAAIREATRA